MITSPSSGRIQSALSKQPSFWVGFVLLACFAGSVDADTEDRATVAHAVVGSVAWAFVFPMGAIVIRVAKTTKSWFLHAAIQTLGIALVTVGAGNGIYVALATDQLNDYHPIIGLVLFSLVFIQAAGGLLAHFAYTKTKSSNVFGHAHRWLGRAIITLGIINGGLGLLLSGDGTRGQYIAYGVVAAVIWVAFVANAIMFELQGSKSSKIENGQSVKPDKAQTDDENKVNER